MFYNRVFLTFRVTEQKNGLEVVISVYVRDGIAQEQGAWGFL